MWVALRTPHGELEPAEELADQEIEYLTVQAGLQGLTLEEWMATILQTDADREEREAPGKTAKELMGEWVELSLEADLYERLQRLHRRIMPGYSFGEFVCLTIRFLAYAGHVLLAQRLQEEGLEPSTLADRLIGEGMQWLELYPAEEEQLRRNNLRDYEQQKKAEVYGRFLGAVFAQCPGSIG